jgi:hypothetical protein
MKMRIVFLDGTWIEGKRDLTIKYRETSGTHHFRVLATSEHYIDLIGDKIAVVISNVRYFILLGE